MTANQINNVMNKCFKLLSGIVAVAGIVSMVSCKDNENYAGVWKSKTPADITAKMPMTANVSVVTTLELQKNQQQTDGIVRLSDSYNISEKDSVGNIIPISAVATVDGTWQPDVDDHDDLLMTFNMSSIKIDVNGDSARVATWRPEIERVFRENITRYSVIEDIDIKDNGKLMSLEINNPDTKLFFDRVQP